MVHRVAVYSESRITGDNDVIRLLFLKKKFYFILLTFLFCPSWRVGYSPLHFFIFVLLYPCIYMFTCTNDYLPRGVYFFTTKIIALHCKYILVILLIYYITFISINYVLRININVFIYIQEDIYFLSLTNLLFNPIHFNLSVIQKHLNKP